MVDGDRFAVGQALSRSCGAVVDGDRVALW